LRYPVVGDEERHQDEAAPQEELGWQPADLGAPRRELAPTLCARLVERWQPWPMILCHVLLIRRGGRESEYDNAEEAQAPSASAGRRSESTDPARLPREGCLTRWPCGPP